MRTILLLLCLVAPAEAFDNGQYGNVDPKIRSWFEGVRSPHGVPCCSMSDGHSTIYDIRHDGYWVPIEGEWRQVPPESIVYTTNPTGEAVVWWVRQGVNTYYIRCFVPDSQG
jgi:hypothetical protein